jgi:glycosyltransferase involved in cell wall biosynthesis
LIVQDGGSSDQSAAILEHYRGAITHCTSEPDHGQSDAINKGLARATGDLITFIGSDDLYLPGALVEIARLATVSPDAGTLVGAFQFVAEDGVPWSEIHRPLDLSLAPPGSWRLHQVATFYRRGVLDRIGRHVRTDLRYTMDRDLLYRAARAAPIATTERSLAAFRLHLASKSVGQWEPFHLEMARLHEEPADTAEEPPAIRRRRKRLGRYWRAKGQIKAAVAAPRPGALPHLVRSVLLHPGMLAKRRLWTAGLQCLRRPAPSSKSAP